MSATTSQPVMAGLVPAIHVLLGAQVQKNVDGGGGENWIEPSRGRLTRRTVRTAMGIRNYLVEGGSGSGKTAVAAELERRGYDVVHGDRVLACQGDPRTGARLDPRVIAAHRSDPAFIHDHHIWDASMVTARAADRTHAATFFCGGARNSFRFLDLFDAVFVLEIDRATLERRLDGRPDEWGSAPAERALILRHHAAPAPIPETAIPIDATAPLPAVVDAILRHCG